MPKNRSRQASRDADGDRFDTTHWSMVLAAGQRSTPDSNEALSTLCQNYWYPLYAYVRRRVADPNEAQDLIQEFFSRLLEKNLLALARPDRGRFRSFLLTALRHFLTNQWQKAQAQKRGGGQLVLSLDFESAEYRYALEPADADTPERLFERKWAEALLERVMRQLDEEQVRAGKGKHFEILRVFLTGRSASVSYATAARQLGVSEGAAMVAAHRLRRRYRDILR